MTLFIKLPRAGASSSKSMRNVFLQSMVFTLRHGVIVLSFLTLGTLPSLEIRAQSVKATAALLALPTKVVAPTDNVGTPEKVELGKQLFFDPRLSGDNRMSCATCHVHDKAFADGLAVAEGHAGKKLARNTQSCLNVGFLTNFFWDGRAASLEQQALGPIESPEEMHQDLGKLEQELRAVDGYVQQFQIVFGNQPNRQDIARALAAFQRTLVTSPSPVDRFLRGDKQALSPDAKRGMELFTGEAGCIECHRGPALSDGKFYRLGLPSMDEGRAKITDKPEDRFRFRTPSLRNVAQTAPYMHDGSMKTLFEVVTFYYRGVPNTGPGGLAPDVPNLAGQSFSDIPYLVEFLNALSSEPLRITPPILPK